MSLADGGNRDGIDGNSKGAIDNDDDEIINEISAGGKLHAHAMHASFHCASPTSVLWFNLLLSQSMFTGQKGIYNF